MRRPRRCATGLIVTVATAVTVGLIALGVVMSMATQSPAPVNVDDDSEIRICHVADFHAAVERRADRVGKQYYTRCARSKFPLSKVTIMKKILNDNCDLKFFTGDLMHGGDYDLLEENGSILPEGIKPEKQLGIARQLLPYWNIDAWSPGNHELTDDFSLRGLIGQDQPSLICSNLKSTVTNILPYKKFVLTSPVKASVCVFGVIRPELVDRTRDLYETSDPLESLEEAFQQSLVDGCGDQGTLIILLSHSGWDDDMDLIRRVRESPKAPRINIVLGGHTHNLIPVTYPHMVEETALSHVGAYGGWVGAIAMHSTIIGNNRKYKYTPWSNDERDHKLAVLWHVKGENSKRISTRYRVVKQQVSTTTRKLQNEFLDTRSTIQDEVEHGVLLRTLMPPTESFTNILDYIPIGYNAFKYLCGQDHNLLGEARDRLIQIVGNLTSQHVSEVPPAVLEKSIDCRRGQCTLGRLLGQVIMLAPTATAKIAIHCTVSSIMPAEESTSDERQVPNDPPTLKTVMTVIGAIQAGLIRSGIPPDCDSQFEYLAGGCSLKSRSTHLDLYDVERILPFHNQLRVIIIKDLDAICDIVQQSTQGWLTHRGSFPGVTHFGNLRYFSNPNQYPQEVMKGRQPFFDELWTLNDSEVLGVEIRNLQGEAHRGTCRASDDGRLRWHCVKDGCAANIGKILIVAPELLIQGGDGSIIKWHEHADKDFLRSVATNLVPEDSSLGCWLDGLKDFTVNDAAALFLNASVALEN